MMRNRLFFSALWALFLYLSPVFPGTDMAWSARPGMGSIPYADENGTGVTFRVWAPNASSVAVRGDFNGWGQTPLFDEGNGLWARDIPAARAGQEYQYFINGQLWRRDPRARQVTGSTGNSIIYDPDAFDWNGTSIPEPWRNDLVLYQMHVGTFGGQLPPSTFDRAVERLDHVRDLGINAILLMPVNEFPGQHSWGYNPTDLFAIATDYGGPRALKRFVRAAHEHGIAVFMDVVHNHYGPTDLDIWRFDGWYENNLGGIYFYNDERAHTPWGSTRPDYGRPEVRAFIRDQMFMWVEEYRIGGFRWDSVYHTIHSDWGHNQEGEHMLRDINWELMQEYPHVIRGSEDHAFDYSMNFENQWDVAYRWDLRDTVVTGSDSDRNMYTIKNLLDGWPGHHRVVFSEAHDYIAASHGRSRIPTEIHGEEPESIYSRKRSLLAAGIIMTTPGIPMIFQGQEMLETQAFHDDTPLRWDRANTFSGMVQAYTDLIHTRRNRRGGAQGLKGTGINVHHVNNDDKVIAYIRWDAGGQADDVVVVANFANTTWTNNDYNIAFPSAGTWHSHFNSDLTLYQEDFDNIGPAQVEATGNPPSANVNMGRYSIQIFSKSPPTGVGLVTFDPPAPAGCIPVEITFDPVDGPLQDATNVVLFVGHNNWQDAADVPMTNQNGTWATTVEVEEGTYELNMAFHDGAEEDPVWDANEGRDWRLEISGCAELPGVATADPPHPHGCVPVVIQYRERDGELAGAENLYLHLGRNGWQHPTDISMTNTANGEWSVTYTIPQGTWQLDFVFHDGEDNWDNNDWNDWHVYVTGCVASDRAGISITHPGSDMYVPYTQDVFTVHGRASRMDGLLHWENTKTGESDAIPVLTNWVVETISIDLGANLFRITGTNTTDNPNAGARDSATNAVYVNAGNWTSGQNGGQGWGEGWELNTSGSAGHFLASGEHNQNTLPQAWGLWANSGGLSEAVRPFADRLHVGDVFSARLENNWIFGGSDTEPAGSVGIGLRNRFGQHLFEFLFVGGGTNYLVNDAETGRDTGLSWTTNGLDLTFELTSSTEYRFTANNTEITGTLATTSEALVREFRVWNYSAGHGSNYNVYVSDMAIDGDPLESREHSASRNIIRRYGPHFTFGTMDKPGEFRVHFPATEIGQMYEVYFNTNLVDGDWEPFGYDAHGDGFPLQIILTNDQEYLFFRTGVRPVQ